jgi:hypothetical protein
MELELTFPRKSWISLMVIPTILALAIALGLVGKWITPSTEQVLSWEEWQILKSQRQYHREYQQLQKSAEGLSLLLDHEPDPVRAQLLSDSIQKMTGLSSLDYQRQLLNEAAQAVRNWAVGAIDKGTANLSVEKALEALPSQEIDP